MTITGEIVKISEVQNVTDTFRKLDFVIRTDEEQYPNYYLVQAVRGAIDSMSNRKLGERMTIDVTVKGIKYAKKDGSGDGYFTTLEMWRIGTNEEAAPPERTSGEDIPF